MNSSIKDEHETVEDRLPRDIDKGNLEMSMKDEFQEYKALKKNLKNIKKK